MYALTVTVRARSIPTFPPFPSLFLSASIFKYYSHICKISKCIYTQKYSWRACILVCAYTCLVIYRYMENCVHSRLAISRHKKESRHGEQTGNETISVASEWHHAVNMFGLSFYLSRGHLSCKTDNSCFLSVMVMGHNKACPIMTSVLACIESQE